MKTLGEILSNARIAKNLSPTDIADQTKIEIKHIHSLEKNDYSSLPSPTFTKGFIRNYALAVNKDPNEMIAIYRRDSIQQSKDTPPPGSRTFSINKALFSISKSTLSLTLLGFLIFFSYLIFQYRALVIPPPLILTQPSPSAVTTSPVTIEGKTSSDSLITINDTKIKPEQSGIFISQINFSPGDHQIIVIATNRYGRTATKTLTVSIISQ